VHARRLAGAAGVEVIEYDRGEALRAKPHQLVHLLREDGTLLELLTEATAPRPAPHAAAA
jgi:hypothetical protein